MKFEVFQSEKSDKYYFRLKARNGQIILSSQGYSSKAAAVNGAESVKRNAENDDHFLRKEASNGKFYFNLIAGNQQIIGNSQMYASKAGMENGIESVKTNAVEADIEFVENED